jgi:hypothetical protein
MCVDINGTKYLLCGRYCGTTQRKMRRIDFSYIDDDED